jgi:aromatic ring-opening dioxygenase catalytic subunit (LigB family)
MAELVGVFAASHAPLIARDWEKLPAASRDIITADFRELGRRLAAAKPDALVMLSPDHWTNFFLDNLPSICIGVGEEHDGPPEPFMKDFARKIAGHAALGQHIATTALKDDFEPSISHRMALDHGFCIPLAKMELQKLPRIVPIVVNDLEPPMPSIKRCLAWGKLLASAIASYPERLRIAILATGGLSHSIGEPTMGAIDEEFDRDCIRALQRGAEGPLIQLLDARMEAAGNGTHEVRNWVIAHAAAGSRGFDLIDYRNMPEVYVGCGWASWKVGTA